MENYYIALLVFLGLLAVFDLFVGVSNDAVNFLNSALGCRISSFKTLKVGECSHLIVESHLL